jgi:hypothetical protein
MTTSKLSGKREWTTILAIILLIITALVNIVFLLGAGFSGEEGSMFLGENILLATLLKISTLSLACNLFATIKIKRMLLLGSLILAGYPLLFTLLMLINPNDRPGFFAWLISTSMIFIASFMGGLIGLLYRKIKM